MFPWNRETKTEREHYLEYELERERELNRQYEQAEEARRAALRREWAESAAFMDCTAADWPEALRKQAALFAREFDPTDDDQWFEHGAAACERALALWDEIAASKQTLLDDLRAQIAAVEDSIRVEVSERLAAEGQGRRGWNHVANAIREEDPERWLDW